MSTSSRPSDADNINVGPEMKGSVRWKSTSMAEASTGKVVELDARQLAKDCLKELSQEMGVAR